MTFEECWTQYLYEGGRKHFNIHANKETAKVAWNAAIEAAANAAEEQDCDQTEYNCATIDRAALAIRLLSSKEDLICNANKDI